MFIMHGASGNHHRIGHSHSASAQVPLTDQCFLLSTASLTKSITRPCEFRKSMPISIFWIKFSQTYTSCGAVMPFTSIFTSAVPQISNGRLLAPRTCWIGRRTWVSCDLTLPNSSLLMSVYSSCGVEQGFNLGTVTRQDTKRALSVVTLETRSTWRELKLGSVS